MKLIDKNTLVTEIEGCINKCNDKKKSCPVNTQVEAICDNEINTFKEVISLINNLEVKEMDLEKESELIANGIMISVQSNKYGTNI